MSASALDRLRDAGCLADIDRHFALLMAELGASPSVALTAAVASARHRVGHTCLPLGGCAGQPVARIADWLAGSSASLDEQAMGNVADVRLPQLAELRSELNASAVVETSIPPIETNGGERCPLVLDGDRLYLQRVFEAERRVAERLKSSAGDAYEEPSARGSARGFPSHEELATLEATIARLFRDAGNEFRSAARAATAGKVCIVTGGPGTGKTTMAARLIALLVELGLASPRRIGLATPTGKAATRLQESVASQMGGLVAVVPKLAEFVPAASTAHSLLGRGRLARLDTLIVDECSMLDLKLMARLLAELPEAARLILLGDAAQLSSVAPGSVFSDICGAGESGTSALGNSLVRLTTSHRFAEDGGIGRLAAAVVDGNARAAIASLEDPTDSAVAHVPLAEDAFVAFAEAYAVHDCIPVIEAIRRGEHASFPSRRVLCAHRTGPFGVRRFNAVVERSLRDRNLIRPGDDFYIGRPIIITRNDRPTGLSNGDTGIVIQGEDGLRQVWFPDLTPAGATDRFLVAPARLPEHESFFALTVHRAQGSEYDEVAFVPGPAESRVNTRELLYTALTRARQKVTIHGDPMTIRAAIARKTERASGLLDRLGSV